MFLREYTIIILGVYAFFLNHFINILNNFFKSLVKTKFKKRNFLIETSFSLDAY